MPMVSPPVAGYITDTSTPAPGAGGVAGGTAWFEQLRNFVAQLFGGAAEAAVTLASDTFTPTQAAIVLDTEGSAATDNLALIGQGSGVPAGWEIRIRGANAARVITVKHNTGGTGTIFLADEADLVLSDPSMMLHLQRRGTAWYEVYRSYGNNKAGLTAWLNAATASLKGLLKTATTTTTITGTATDQAVTPDSLAALWEDGGDLSNGGTITFPEGGSFRLITSTTAITAFAFTTSKAGRRVICKLATDRTITANGNIEIVPGGASIAGKSGDVFEVEDRGSGNARINWYVPATGRAVVAPTPFVPRGYISPDFKLSNNGTTPNTQIDYTAGQIVDDANAEIIALGAGTIDLATNGANGLDTGSLAASATGYWAHLIASGSTYALIASLSYGSPTLPGGYSVKRSGVAMFVTKSASAHVATFTRGPDGIYRLKDPASVGLIYASTLGSGGTVNIGTKLPTGRKVAALVRFAVTSTGAQRAAVYDPDGSSQGTGLASDPPLNSAYGPAGNVAGGELMVVTNTSAQFGLGARNDNAATQTVYAELLGWASTGQ